MTLDYCRDELRSIINELKDIEAGIRKDFEGIGNEVCADRIGQIASKYDKVLRQLNNVNQNLITEIIGRLPRLPF